MCVHPCSKRLTATSELPPASCAVNPMQSVPQARSSFWRRVEHTSHDKTACDLQRAPRGRRPWLNTCGICCAAGTLHLYKERLHTHGIVSFAGALGALGAVSWCSRRQQQKQRMRMQRRSDASWRISPLLPLCLPHSPIKPTAPFLTVYQAHRGAPGLRRKGALRELEPNLKLAPAQGRCSSSDHTKVLTRS